MSLPCTTADLIPQKGKMGFDQILVDVHHADGESTAEIGEDQIFLDDHRRLANPALVEYINQLSAAVHGYHEKISGKLVKKGLFVGLQNAEFYQPVYSGDRLALKAKTTEAIAQVSFVAGKVERDGECIAEFVTKLYEIEDTAELERLFNRGRSQLEENFAAPEEGKSPVHLSSHLHRKLFSYFRHIQIADDLITFDLACPGDLEAFDGHFPGSPLLPGIVLLEIGRLAMMLLLNQSVLIKSIQKMKIGGVVLPDQVIGCAVKIDEKTDSDWGFSAIIKGGNGKEISRYNGRCMKEEKNG